jgi:hypothetical protein
MTRLVRTKRKIHLHGCRHAACATAAPWVWAEGRDDSEWIYKSWLVPCQVCLPALHARQQELAASANPGEQG